MSDPRLARVAREVLLTAGAVFGVLCLTMAIASFGFGVKPLVFRSGSMAPAIGTGDLGFATTVDAAGVEVDDVVSVLTTGGDRVTHRVVDTAGEGATRGLTLRGDANTAVDAEVYRVESVEKVLFSIPRMGYVVEWLSGRTALVLVALYALGMLALVDRSGGRGSRSDRDDRPAPPSGRLRRFRRREPGRTILVRRGLIVGLSGILAVGVAPAWAAWVDDAPVTVAGLSANKYFTCDAGVRGSGSPYLYWKLNETGSTVAADASGNGRTGQLTGSASSTPNDACARDAGAAVVLNGTNSLISQTSATAPGPGTFTLSLWFRTTTTRGGKLIGFGNARTGASGQYDRHLYLTDTGRVVFGVYPNVVRTVTSPTAYNDDAWHHAVATLSGAGMRLYVDGALVASDTATTTAQNYSGFWRVGYDNLNTWTTRPTSDYFAGAVDEVAVYTSALSATDIAAMYRAGT